MKIKLLAAAAGLLAAAAFATPAAAERVWQMVTDGDVAIPMTQVSYLVAADDAQNFSVVRTDGSLVEGVTSVSFSQSEPVGVTEIAEAGRVSLLSNAVAESLTLQEAAGREVAVYDLDGRCRIALTAADDAQKVNVSTLESGMYILRAGNVSIRFIKK